MPADKDSISNTFIVATSVCLVCSLIVSSAAVGLKSIQDRNVALDKKKNILQVSGFAEDEINQVGIEALFDQRFKVKLINLETGEDATSEELGPMLEAMKLQEGEQLTKYDQIKAAKSKLEAACDQLDKATDIAQIKFREKYSFVYLQYDESGENVQSYVFPIRGYGLWSTLKGYLSVQPDFQTINGLTYYEHAETPGLGGEVDNPAWKAKWSNKKIYGDDQSVRINVIKGVAGDNPYGVDGLSGATITSKGVTSMLQYWLGPNGFGPFINKTKTGGTTAGKSAAGGNHG